MSVVKGELGEAREQGKRQDHHEGSDLVVPDQGEVDGKLLPLPLLLLPPSAVPQGHRATGSDYRR